MIDEFDYEAPEVPEESACDEAVSPIGRALRFAVSDGDERSPVYWDVLNSLLSPRPLGGGTDAGSGA